MTPIVINTAQSKYLNPRNLENKHPIVNNQIKENNQKQQWDDNYIDIKYKTQKQLDKEKEQARRRNQEILEEKKIRIQQIISVAPTVDELQSATVLKELKQNLNESKISDTERFKQRRSPAERKSQASRRAQDRITELIESEKKLE